MMADTAKLDAEREILQAAINWNHEYKSINNLASGDPYWVSWAEEELGMKSKWDGRPHESIAGQVSASPSEPKAASETCRCPSHKSK